jgi:trimeric autotransporter adhesin
MSALRSAIALALIVMSVLASSVFAAVAVPQPAPVAPAAGSAAPGDSRWDDHFAMEFGRRFNNSISMTFNAAAEFNGELYVGGSFGNSPAFNTLSYIARWNGRQWNSVGAGQWNPSSRIYDLAVHENRLYATGIFTTAAGVAANNIASWDGQQWQALGSGLSGSGYSLVSYGGDLYVGGNFSAAGGVAAKGVARWDGAAWHAVGAGLEKDPNSAQGGAVTTLVVTPHGLYAGGGFGRSGAQEVYTLALWNGSQWSAVIPDLRGLILAMDWHNGALYFGGVLSIGQPSSAAIMVRWDGAQWQSLANGLGTSSRIAAIRSINSELYVLQEEDLYRWDGAEWKRFGSPLVDPGVSWIMRDIVSYNNNLHVVGGVACATTACQAKFVLAWDGDKWRGLGNGVDSTVGISHIAVADGQMYIFSQPGWEHIAGSELNQVSKWDGAAWTDYTIPYSGGVTTLLGSGARLYVAKSIRSSSQYTSTVYLREGDNWTALPGTFSGVINTLVYTDGVLYAGGYFSAVDGVAASGVARWDGAAWVVLGGGPQYNVMSLALHDGAVYAAGSLAPYPFIYNSGGLATRWDGAGWTQIATADMPIDALAATSDGSVYVGGYFRTINELPIANFARWRAGAWEAVSADLIGPVLALEVAPDGALYVGGDFASQTIPGLKGIARYDGTWQPLGSGVDGAVLEIESSGGDLYVGGRLTRAGDKSSEGVAIWHRAANATPQAAADTATTLRGQAVDIAVLANDTDADQDGLTITGVTTPSHGVAQVVGATVRYTPAGNYVGSDSFGYTISDGRGGTSGATVTVTVAAPTVRIFLPAVRR